MPPATAITPANQAAVRGVSIDRSRPRRRRAHAAHAYTVARYSEVSASTRQGGGPSSVRSSPVKIPNATSGAQRQPRVSSSAMTTPVFGFQGVILVWRSGWT